MEIGANYLADGRCKFTVWAPRCQKVGLQLSQESESRRVEMQQQERGYWTATVASASPNSTYLYQLDDSSTLRPDPASQLQPQGVHGPSQVVDRNALQWTDSSWSGMPLEEFVIYELHVGTFTPEGTLAAIVPRLQSLKELGITAIELMPLAQFPGDRNWGYDGTYPFSVHTAYGGPNGLKQLVDACHQQGLAVVLDVVYNHFGPEGNYSSCYGPYLTDRYRTPWGSALDFDGPNSDGIRNFFIQNALFWLREYRIDALRLDAIHAIYDFSAKHFLAELAEAVDTFEEQSHRQVHLIAESDLNDTRIIRPADIGGYGIDAQWSDDFHHALHALLTGEQQGYYQDFGQLCDFEKAWRASFVYDWKYSHYRQRYHGSDASDRPTYQFAICAQNHDQVGNRMLGERLARLVSFEAIKLSAAATLLSPYIPLLFMGEEYGETAPFRYFVSHTDPELVEAVRQGRKAEFAHWRNANEMPDPQSIHTFEQSKLDWDMQFRGKHAVLRQFYRELLQIRRHNPALRQFDRACQEVSSLKTEGILLFRRWQANSQILGVMNFGDRKTTIAPVTAANQWTKRLDSADMKWEGPGNAAPSVLQQNEAFEIQALSAILYEKSTLTRAS
ncbi:malto-oligosyltrehalose trehalohydrolase [Synechococcus sp. PCC 7336]|uniref:malto-oligosyltrehalose trehalohydrolase n=1 Tax=Synechococcus sp. PCC 7336 TaxID=195250 RepID=UPI00047765AA|nr:malto-oligosyltrehalose trehalohydrolase [Synechococcus sp. PCC 7336]